MRCAIPKTYGEMTIAQWRTARLPLSALGADAWRACGVEGGGSRWQISPGAQRCRVIDCVSLHRRSRHARRASRIASADLVPPIR